LWLALLPDAAACICFYDSVQELILAASDGERPTAIAWSTPLPPAPGDPVEAGGARIRPLVVLSGDLSGHDRVFGPHELRSCLDSPSDGGLFLLFFEHSSELGLIPSACSPQYQILRWPLQMEPVRVTLAVVRRRLGLRPVVVAAAVVLEMLGMAVLAASDRAR